MIQFWQFGTRTDGQAITAFQLTSDAGFRVIILDQGAILQSLHTPNGRNLVLGFETWEPYQTDTNYIGRIIGPNANRISKAQFHIDGKVIKLPTNDGHHNLHSGPDGFDRQIWEAVPTDKGLTLQLQSPDGQNGFPGPVKACLNFSLVQNRLRIEMQATTDRATPINLTWHPYWNLSGSPRIDGHNLRVDAESHTALETRGPRVLNETRFDFRQALPLGCIQLDSNYADAKSARLISGQTAMTVTSSLPDMQVYTGDALDPPRAGIALEPQYRPNDINLARDSLLRPGAIYNHWIEYLFDTP